MSEARRQTSWMSWVFEVGADFYAWITAQDAWRANFRALVSKLPDRACPCIVDLGCGPGVSTFELLRARPEATVVGLDLAWRMLHQARRRERSMGLSKPIGWIRADATLLPFRSESADAMTGHSFLYLVPDRDRALAECLRVLKPGGRLILMEPNDEGGSFKQLLSFSKNPRFLLSMTLWRPVSYLHGRFTPKTLTETLERAGFGTTSIEPILGGLGLLACAEKR